MDIHEYRCSAAIYCLKIKKESAGRRKGELYKIPKSEFERKMNMGANRLIEQKGTRYFFE